MYVTTRIYLGINKHKILITDRCRHSVVCMPSSLVMPHGTEHITHDETGRSTWPFDRVRNATHDTLPHDMPTIWVAFVLALSTRRHVHTSKCRTSIV